MVTLIASVPNPRQRPCDGGQSYVVVFQPCGFVKQFNVWRYLRILIIVMANCANQHEFPDSSIFHMKLFEIIRRGKVVQEHILRLCYPGIVNDLSSLIPYLYQLHSAARIRRVFNAHERHVLDSSTDLSRLDITLMHKLILYSNKLSNPHDQVWNTQGDSLEYHLTALKNKRNFVVHMTSGLDYQTYLQTVEELRHIFWKILLLASSSFVVERETCERLWEDLESSIDGIINQDIRPASSGENVFVTDIKSTYTRLSYFSPLCNLFGDTRDVQVNNVFTQMKMTVKENEKRNDNYSENIATEVGYDDLLMVTEKKLKQTNKNNIIVFLEGPAGSGKTTLTRKIIHDWSSDKNKNTMNHLTEYEFVLLFECKKQNLKSLPDLLASLLPCESEEIKKEDLVEKLKNKKILFIVDGLDELNPSSSEVFSQILQMGKSHNIVILCTVRPYTMNSIKSYIPENFEVLNVEIIGITARYREEFIMKYCRNFCLTEEKHKDMSNLLTYLRSRNIWRQDHWQLPFNLVLLTILWFNDSQAVNRLTTVTELFSETYTLSKKRVENRLTGGISKRGIDQSMVRKKVEICLKAVFKEAFISHLNDSTGLDEASIQRLQDTCDSFKLPSKEILSAFLVKANSDESEVVTYNFPHKGLQEFYVAMYIKEGLQDLDISQILLDIEARLQSSHIPVEYRQRILTPTSEVLREYETCKSSRTIMNSIEQIFLEVVDYSGQEKKPLDLKKLHSIFIHLIGLMYMKTSVSEKRADEIITLLKDSCGKSRVHWLYMLSLINCDDTLVKYFADMMTLTDKIVISDKYIDTYTRVLKYAQPKSVLISINDRPQDVPLQELFTCLHESWEVKVCLEQDFENPRSIDSDLDESLKEMFQRCRITGFSGILSSSTATFLPNHLQSLNLSVLDSGQYESLVLMLNLIPFRQPNLKHLWLHMKGRVVLSKLKPLPAVQILDLTLNDIGEADVDWACQAVKELQPVGNHKGYSSLKFPGASNNIAVCEKLICGLANKGIKVREGLEFSPMVSTVVKEKLQVLCREKLWWKLDVMEEEDIWTCWWSRS